MAFAGNERKELVKNLYPEILAKVQQLGQASKVLVYAASQLDLARLGENEALAKKWAGIVDEVYMNLKEEFPAPDTMPSHEERKVMVEHTMDLVEDQFVLSISPLLNKEEKETREMFGNVRATIEMVVVLIGMYFL